MKIKLTKFTVQGFRNFSEPLILDFQKTHDYQFNKECIVDGVISKIGIYGPNGSGKSNFGLALFSIVPVLTDKYVDNATLNPSLFLNLDGKTKCATFIYEFKSESDIFIYSFSKKTEDALSRESLEVNGSVIYEYDYSDNRFLSIQKGDIISNNLNFEYISSNLSILRYIANNSNQKETSPIRQIMDFVSHMLWFRSVPSNAFIGLESSVSILEDWIIKNGFVKDFNQFLNATCALDIKLEIVKGIDRRDIIVEKHKNGILVFNQASSSGTTAAMLFYYWMKHFKDVSFLFMDEFDAYYHFALSENIIGILKGVTDMQAIFTTHNSALLNNRILRPDCYFFIKNNTIKSYADKAGGREIREGHNLEKIYRNGGLDE